MGADVDLKIQSPSWETSAEISRLLREELARHPGIVDIQDDYSRDKQFMEVTVDESQGQTLGLDQQQLLSWPCRPLSTVCRWPPTTRGRKSRRSSSSTSRSTGRTLTDLWT